MEQVNTFRRNLVSKLIIFTITFSALYFVFDTYEVSYKNYRSMQTTLENRIEHAETLKKEINDYQVKIDNLKAFSKFISLKLKQDVRTNKEIIKISIVKKYLFISLKSKLIFAKNNLFIKIFFGLLKERIWFNEYFVNE